MTLENCLTISITDLTRKGDFKISETAATINLIKNNEALFKLNVTFVANGNEKFATFVYPNAKDNMITHKIRIASVPSNIGNGFVKYFVCPITGKFCRKLYYQKMRFVHRETTGLLYEQQAKKQPISKAGYLTLERRNEPYTKNFKKYYKGDYTKRYFQILIRTSHSEFVDAYERKYGVIKQK